MGIKGTKTFPQSIASGNVSAVERGKEKENDLTKLRKITKNA